MPMPSDCRIKSLEALEQALDEDLLVGPLEMAISVLEERGMDVEAIRAVGDKITHELQEKHRLAWRDQARQRLHRGRVLEPDEDDLPTDHASLLLMIEQARAHPRLREQLSMKFAGRRAEEADAEELAGLLREIRLLVKLMDEESEDS